ncbi:MAG: hypothetical protein GOV00_04460 [Candidatus Altiarchaeota archaeon]|nr:hypothetical protein [Candidatus Altiarchaeota archaeon]
MYSAYAAAGQASLLNILDSISGAESETKAESVETFLDLVKIREDCGDPLAVAISPERARLDTESLEAHNAFMKTHSTQTKLSEVLKIETISSACSTWLQKAGMDANSFTATEVETAFYNSLVDKSTGSLIMFSPLYVPSTLNKNQDLILSRYCEGDCENTRKCIACWDLYLENKDNAGEALTALRDNDCAGYCGVVCMSVKESLSYYDSSLSATTSEEKTLYLRQFIDAGIDFS